MDIQNITKEKGSRYINIEKLLKIYNCEIIYEKEIYKHNNSEERCCDEYEFLIRCKTDNKFYILNALYHETPYDDYEPYYSKFELKPFETEIIIDEKNIDKYKYVKEEIEEFLNTRKKKLNINQVEIKLEFNPFYYNKRIIDYYKDITFEESCIYDLWEDKKGEFRLIEGDSGSGIIHIKKDKYYVKFRYAEQWDFKKRELNLIN
jgi:hypothetical protein